MSIETAISNNAHHLSTDDVKLLEDTGFLITRLEQGVGKNPYANAMRTLCSALTSALVRAGTAEKELARRNEYVGCNCCATGDCPHSTVHECCRALAGRIEV